MKVLSIESQVIASFFPLFNNFPKTVYMIWMVSLFILLLAKSRGEHIPVQIDIVWTNIADVRVMIFRIDARDLILAYDLQQGPNL